jgi:hypothetical protein
MFAHLFAKLVFPVLSSALIRAFGHRTNRDDNKDRFLKRNRPPLSRQRNDVDVESDVLQSLYEPEDVFFLCHGLELTRAKILIESSVLKHVVNGCKDRGGHCADGFLGSAPGTQAMILGLEVAALRAAGCPGALD